MTGRRNLYGLIAAFVLVAVGCGLEQSHGYVQSTDGSLSFRHPLGWEEVEVQPAGLEWVTGVDGALVPSNLDPEGIVRDEPFIVAQVYPLDRDRHDQASRSVLRTLAIDGRRDPIAGDDPTIRVLFYEDIVDDRGFEGHHIRFEVQLEDGTAVAEQIAVLDPERTSIQRVRVACSIVCFESNSGAIDDIFDSVRFR